MSGAEQQLSRIDREELLALAVRALCAQGLREEDARDAATILVLTDMFGVSTHGIGRLPSYAERLRIGGINAVPSIGVEHVTPSLIRVDGDNGLGPLVGYRALKAAMAATEETGIALALVRGSNHFGATMPYAYLAAEAGFATIIGSNATTTIAPWGGNEARLGNNPLGIGMPNPAGEPIILDMAMSVVARAKIRLAAQEGRSIPETWATDRQGRPTTDPHQALDGFLSPIGGHKGYGLALMVDLFAGLLSGATYLTHVSSWVDAPEKPQNLGHFFLVIDVARLGRDRLGTAMNDFLAILKETPTADGMPPVRLPGEIEMERLRNNARVGVELPSRLRDELLGLCDEKA